VVADRGGELRIEDVDQDRGDDHLGRRARAVFLYFHAQRAALAKRAPGHVEQVRHAQIFQDLEGKRAGVQERREPHDRRRHVRDDAERASERSDDARPRPSREAGRQREQNPGAGRDDDDQRRHQKFDAHKGLPSAAVFFPTFARWHASLKLLLEPRITHAYRKRHYG
jgi:hypothetical protein